MSTPFQDWLDKRRNAVDTDTLDNIIEDLMVSHNFEYARQALIEWRNAEVARSLPEKSQKRGKVWQVGTEANFTEITDKKDSLYERAMIGEIDE